MKIPKNRNGLKGFTLVETAIVVTVGAIILSAGLSGYKTYLNKERYEMTKERISKVAKALDDYRKLPSNTNKNLPCPAPLHTAPGAAGYGHDVAKTLGVACNSAPGAALGDTVSRQSGPLSPLQYVRIGAVPFADLNISAEDTQDAWGRRFIYAVSEKHTDTTAMYDADKGSITIKDDTTGTIGGDKAPFFVYTPGKSGAGGITADGTDYHVPCSAASTKEQNNCAWTSGSGATRIEFRAATYSESGGSATNFDDITVYDYEDDDVVSKCNDLIDCISDNASRVFLGEGAGEEATTGINNTSIGINSLGAITTGTNNTAVGFNALLRNTAGINNVALGSNTLANIINGSSNVAVGSSALSANTAVGNTAVGFEALRNNTAGYIAPTTWGNTAVGWQALMANTVGTANTAVGAAALTSANNSGAINNTAIGAAALWRLTSGYGNTAVGTNALQSNSIGFDNAAVGVDALLSNNNTNNTAVGRSALRGNVNGSGNTAVGRDALMANGNSNYNVAVGMLALQANTADYNTAMGYRALAANTAPYNAAVGAHALAANVSGQFNTALGYGALASNTAGLSSSPFHWANTAVGGNALATNVSGYNNVAVGNFALYDNVSTNNNTALGAGALRSSVANDNTAVGANALTLATASPLGFGNNTAVGSHALYNTTTGDANTAVGQRALYNNTTAVGNTAVGSEALAANTENDNVAIGRRSLWGSTGGVGNVAVGTAAFIINQNGAHNVMIGTNTNSGGNSTSFNTVVGDRAAAAHSFNSVFGAMARPYDGTTTAQAVIIGVGAQADTNGVAIGAARSIIINPGTPYQTLGITDPTIARRNAVAVGSDAIAEPNAIAIGSTARAVTGHAVMSLGLGYNVLDCYLGGCSLPSDARLKKDVKDIDLGLSFIESLHPVSFYWKEGDDVMNLGFLAQEVEKALGNRKTNVISQQNNKEKTYAMVKDALIAPIVKAIQEIVARLNPLEKTVAEQQKKIEILEQEIKDIRAEMKTLRTQK